MTLAAERAIDFTHSTGEQETAQRAQEWLTKFRAELNQANRKPR